MITRILGYLEFPIMPNLNNHSVFGIHGICTFLKSKEDNEIRPIFLVRIESD